MTAALDAAAASRVGVGTAAVPRTGGDTAAAACTHCGFALWHPVARLKVSSVGLYDDDRFPGRSIVTLHDHFNDLVDLPDALMIDVLADLRRVRDALRAVTGASRVNYAVLGNAEAHVHWHVFPRRPEMEKFPRNSPWQDPRPVTALGLARVATLRDGLRTSLAGL